MTALHHLAARLANEFRLIGFELALMFWLWPIKNPEGDA